MFFPNSWHPWCSNFYYFNNSSSLIKQHLHSFLIFYHCWCSTWVLVQVLSSSFHHSWYTSEGDPLWTQQFGGDWRPYPALPRMVLMTFTLDSDKLHWPSCFCVSEKEEKNRQDLNCRPTAPTKYAPDCLTIAKPPQTAILCCTHVYVFG